jgi:ribosomal protein L40E
VAEKKRCPNCSALNPESAEWCNQCLERFPVPVEEQPAPEVAPVTPEAPTEMPPGDRVAATAVAEPAATGDGSEQAATAAKAVKESGSFRISEDGITWICSVCDAENPIDALTCSVCGTTFARAIQPQEASTVHGDPGNAALYSLFLPGAGHAYLGLWPQAVARAVLSTWVVGIVVLAVIAKGAGSTLVAITFGVVAFGLWLVAAHDAYREARHEPTQVLLRGRIFVYLVMGLLGLLFLMLVTTILRARG